MDIFDNLTLLPPVTLGALIVMGAGLLASGTVKGLIGFGLPLVAVPVMTLVVDGRIAIALMTIPVLVSNLAQGAEGGGWRVTGRRFWPVLVGVALTMPLGLWLLARADREGVAIAMGLVLLCFCASQSLPKKPVVPPRLERRFGLLAGMVGGFFGGVSSFFGPPIVVYLVALNLGRDLFVGVISAIYVWCAVLLYVGLWSVDVLDAQRLVWSVVASLPVLTGVLIGRRLRRGVSESGFRRLVVIVLAIVAVKLIAQGLGLVP